jgi:hypothetical protein
VSFLSTILGKRTVTPSDAGRALAQQRIANERERVKAKAREMRRALGLPDVEALR